ncbi:hypothetical protein CLORAM_00324 [Thomasclavelia ramosa DSM 1402]|uniref:Uncharacterized protein n=1 Tax=Thomasclavelia ramosa DSM 1402 TaxID=445974 RepID=B0N1B9_9FIRM|nr:hypothetical protein CLORAM_00324 [Thomasclavelia ramosa DSM 1402]
MLCPASSNKFPTAIHRVYLFFSDVASLMLHFLYFLKKKSLTTQIMG